MARRRDESLLDILCELPWWISAGLSVSSFISLKYLLPMFEFNSPILKGLSRIWPLFAPHIAIIFLFPIPFALFNSWRKKKLLETQKNLATLKSISWKQFEELVGEAYRRQGYKVSENIGDGPDGGIDLRLRKNGELILVQCKHWKAFKVDVKVVREMYGVMVSENATKAIVITSGTFTQPAKKFASDKPIKLIEGKQLLALIANVQKEPKSKSELNPVKNIPEIKQNQILCPKCGSKMVLRTAKKGPNSGKQFWGCTKFPKCYGSKSI